MGHGGTHARAVSAETLVPTVELAGGRGQVTVAESRRVVAATHSQQNGETAIIDNKMERWVQDLDTLPFEDRDIFSYERIVASRHGWAEVIASRGCPYACTYCFNLPFLAATRTMSRMVVAASRWATSSAGAASIRRLPCCAT